MNEGKSYLGMANPARRSPVGTCALGFNGIRKVDPSQAPVSTALGVLGVPGMTAYVGLADIRPAQARRMATTRTKMRSRHLPRTLLRLSESEHGLAHCGRCST